MELCMVCALLILWAYFFTTLPSPICFLPPFLSLSPPFFPPPPIHFTFSHSSSSYLFSFLSCFCCVVIDCGFVKLKAFSPKTSLGKSILSIVASVIFSDLFDRPVNETIYDPWPLNFDLWTLTSNQRLWWLYQYLSPQPSREQAGQVEYDPAKCTACSQVSYQNCNPCSMGNSSSCHKNLDPFLLSVSLVSKLCTHLGFYHHL